MCLYSLVGSFKCVRKMVHIYRWLASFHDKTTVRSLRFFSFFRREGGREVGGEGMLLYMRGTRERFQVWNWPHGRQTRTRKAHTRFFFAFKIGIVVNDAQLWIGCFAWKANFFFVCVCLFCLRDLMSRRNGPLLFLFIVQCCRNPFEARFFYFCHAIL